MLSVAGKREKPDATEQDLNERRSSNQSDIMSSSFKGARGHLGFKHDSAFSWRKAFRGQAVRALGIHLKWK